MKWLRWLIVALLCLAAPASAFWQSRDSNYNINTGAAPAGYQGPGDVASGYTSPYAWYSCARAFNAAWASGAGNLCLLYGVTTTTTCTLKAAANGFADLTSLSCVGGTVSVTTFCTVTNSSCKVETAYDQSGNSRDVTQATPASMPTLTLSSTPTGTLPAITCSGTLLLATASTFTQAQPLTFSLVGIVTTGGTAGGAIGSASGGQANFGQAGSANNWVVNAGTALTKSASDSAWHAGQGLANGNGTSSAINIDGSDSTGAASTSGLSSAAIRLCRATGGEFVGSIAEAGIWAFQSSSTNRGNINSNQHDATNGYNF